MSAEPAPVDHIDRVRSWMRSAVAAGLNPVTPTTWDAWDDRPASSPRVYQILRRNGLTWPQVVQEAGGVARTQNRPIRWPADQVARLFTRFAAEVETPSIGRWRAWAADQNPPGPSHLTVRAALSVERWEDVPAAAAKVAAAERMFDDFTENAGLPYRAAQ